MELKDMWYCLVRDSLARNESVTKAIANADAMVVAYKASFGGAA